VSPTITMTALPYVSMYYFGINDITTRLTLSLVRATVLEVRHQTSPSQTGTAEPVAADSGLSTGAKIGLAVGIVLGILLPAITALVLWRRRRAQRRLIAPDIHEVSDTQRFGKDGKDLASVPPVTHMHELDSSHTPTAAHELDAMTPTAPTVVGILLKQQSTTDQGQTDSPAVAVSSQSPLKQSMGAPWEPESGLTPVPSPNPDPPMASPSLEPLAANPELRGVTPDPPQQDKLEQLQKELRRVKLERERLQQLQQLESRETELERMIEQEVAKRS